MLNYFRFIKIEHTLFSLPIVFSGTFLALLQTNEKKSISLEQSIWIFLAVLGARASGFGFNRIIDRTIDSQNSRTRNREIPSGKISIFSASIFTAAMALLFMFSAGMLSKLCLILSPIPLVLFLVYPFLKKWTVGSHLGLGIAWGIAPLGGWLAIKPQIHPLSQLIPVFLLTGFSVFWVAGFDIIYALLDEEFDREKGLFSMPAVLGKKNALRISEISHSTAFLFLGLLVQNFLNHSITFFFLIIVGLLLIISHWKVQVNSFDSSLIDFAFFKVNAAIGFAVFLMIFV